MSKMNVSDLKESSSKTEKLLAANRCTQALIHTLRKSITSDGQVKDVNSRLQGCVARTRQLMRERFNGHV